MNLLRLQASHWPLAAVLLTAAVFSVNALWIPAKAGLAQVLLERSWRKTLAGAGDARPWPWADTRAIALLEVPRLGLREIVLAGSSGRNLAFGPAVLNTTPLAETADRIISGHRDTHFRFLRELRTGDRLRLVLPARTYDYRVGWQEVIDSRRQQLVIDNDVERLTLVTCYPFDSLTAGGPLRWVVTAVPDQGARPGAADARAGGP